MVPGGTPFFFEEECMPKKRLLLFLILSGVVTLSASAIWLGTALPASAQCGSQASSCKNCHEVQGHDPVNNDGTDWHQSHAFGDFCYICHGGNQQAVEKEAAHTGMVDPLSDIQASCQQCHPNDLTQRAQVYASALGVQLGNNTQATPAAEATPASASPAPSTQAQTIEQQATELVVNDPNTTDYVQRYNEIVLGKHPTNWGNVILLVMIGAMLVGGGALVLHRERWITVSFEEKKAIEGEYPTDVVEMVPQIAKLKPQARKSLRRLLGKPEATTELLASIDKLIQDDEPNKNG
jgi:hypothetical protein